MPYTTIVVDVIVVDGKATDFKKVEESNNLVEIKMKMEKSSEEKFRHFVRGSRHRKFIVESFRELVCL